MSDNHPALQFKSVSKRYGRLVAVDKLEFEVQAGELFGFLGPNGAGKTTAMKMAAGLVRPSSGQVFIAGWDVQSSPLQAKRLVGFVPDSPYIYESLTGREFLHFCAGLYKMNGALVKDRVGHLCERFVIGAWADQRAGEYSHGMKQRVVTASAFLHNPRVVLIDEPMVGIDPAGVRLFKQVLRDFCREGGTVFLSTHTLSNAEELCDRVAIINKSRLIAVGTLDEIRQSAGGLEDAFLALTAEADP